ncbi:MAG: hypothetical protein U5R30_11095 [Deltaproteobacteria bacterium]|nr:hypothetical protein [Deltaproteobacteria bacterium]
MLRYPANADKDTGQRRELLFQQLVHLFRLDETDQNAYLQPLFSILEERKIPVFLNLFEKVLIPIFSLADGSPAAVPGYRDAERFRLL